MLKISRFNEVIRYDSARSVAGWGYYWTTFYFVDGLLIDTGCAHTAGRLAKAIPRDELYCIINTHSHEDHVGADGILQARNDQLKILAHPLTLPVLSDPRRNQPLQLYRQLFWGWPAPCKAQAVGDGEYITTRNHSFQVLYTPGHSPDHICIYEPDRQWLFTGDLFVGGRDRAVVAGCDIWQLIESLKKMAALPIVRLFPGAAKTRDNPLDDLNARINYLEESGGKVLDLHSQGINTEGIASRLFGNPMLIEYVTLGHFSRRNLVKSFLKRLTEEIVNYT